MATLTVPSSVDPREVERFVRELDRRLERLDRAILVADWSLYTGRSRRGSGPWQLRRARLLSDDRLLSWVRSARRRGGPPSTQRRLELLERVLIDTLAEQSPEVLRLRSELQQKIVAFRPRWNGKRVDRVVVSRKLWDSPKEPERRRAYYALEPLYRPLERSMVRLVELRNERARALGFRDGAEMRLGFQGIRPSELDEWATDAATLLRPRLRALRDSLLEATGQEEWHPWDFLLARTRQVPLPDRLFPAREMLPRILAAMGEWGFRTERMHFRSDFHDIPSGGFTLAPDPPRDIRIVVHPHGGWRAYMVMFHEVGHAVHSASIRAPRHLLRWHENVPGFGAFHEGIAGVFEDIPSRVEWLSRQPGVGARRAEEFARAVHRIGPVDAAYQASWLRVEQELYRHPGRDPMPAVQRFEKRVFGFDDYKPLSFVDGFFVETPLYAPNYLLATLFSAQVTRTLEGLFGRPIWPNRKVGPWLAKQWFAPGSMYDWVPRVREVTGRPFGVRDFERSLAEG